MAVHARYLMQMAVVSYGGPAASYLNSYLLFEHSKHSFEYVFQYGEEFKQCNIIDARLNRALNLLLYNVLSKS